MTGCPSCRAQVDPIDRFCGRCGNALAGIAPFDGRAPRYCGGCGRSLQADATFCRRCGLKVPERHEAAQGSVALRDDVGQKEPVGSLSPRGSTPAQAQTETIPKQNGGRQSVSSPSNAPGTSTATMERTAASLPGRSEAAPVQLPEAGIEAPPSRGTGFPWGGTLALVGSLTVIISAILDWGGAFQATLPRDISAAWLLEPSGVVTAPSLGLVLLVAGTLGALVSLIGMAAPGFTFLRRFVGLLTLMIPLGFAFRTLQLGEGASIPELPSLLGVGAIAAAAGALAEMAVGRPRKRA